MFGVQISWVFYISSLLTSSIPQLETSYWTRIKYTLGIRKDVFLNLLITIVKYYCTCAWSDVFYCMETSPTRHAHMHAHVQYTTLSEIPLLLC